MIRGIRYQKGMNCQRLMDVGLNCIELPYKSKWKMKDVIEFGGGQIIGLSVAAGLLLKDGFLKVLDMAAYMKASYVVLETIGLESADALKTQIELGMEAVTHLGLKVFLENGYEWNQFSDISVLETLVDRWNRNSKKNSFGVCLNTGYATLLGRNLCGIVEKLGNRIGLIHVSDNDGKHNVGQLPYTFTKGRGHLTSDWWGLIGMLAINRYQGAVVFSMEGLWQMSPPELYSAWYELLGVIGKEWERVLSLEEYLKGSDNRILFGAGLVFENYMKVWGTSYPPLFVVDNKENLWGEKRFGVEIRSPLKILKYPEHERRVLVSTMYWRSIENQLHGMGIQSMRYDDRYFFRHQGDIIC